MGYRDALEQIKRRELQTNNQTSTLSPTTEQIKAEINVFLSSFLKKQFFNKQ